MALRLLPKDAQDGGEDILEKNELDFELESAPAVASQYLANKFQMLVIKKGSQTNRELVYVEYKPYQLSGRRGTDQHVIKRACNLGNLLRNGSKSWDEGFHTLPLRCVIQKTRPPRFAFVFQLPDATSKPITLLQWLNDKQMVRPTLGERFKIAKELAVTLFQFHSVGWLHKSVRSENILFFKSDDSHVACARQYLVGFEFSRAEGDQSTTGDDDILERNLYRHPDQQGPPEIRFNIKHDIYALGVVLLEIGLWRAVSSPGFDKFSEMNPDQIQARLQDHARVRLPHHMGDAYTEIVFACMSGAMGSYDQSSEGVGGRTREVIQLEMYEKIVGGMEIGVQL